MLDSIVSEVRQTGKAYRRGFSDELAAALYSQGISFYYSRRNNVTYFAEDIREAQALAVRHR